MIVTRSCTYTHCVFDPSHQSAEDISYNLEDKTFNIAMPHANIRITTYRTGVKVRFGRNKFKLDVLISAMLGAEGSELRLTDIFKLIYQIPNLT